MCEHRSLKDRVISPRAVLAALLFLCAACASPQPLPPLPPPPDPKTQMAALEMRIFDLIQDARHTVDPRAKTLMPDAELARVARQHSQDMAAKNYVAHAGPDGQTSASIVMDQDARFQGLLGENIAAQYYLPAIGIDVDGFAKRFVNTWLASPAHRQNLSLPAYDRSGVGAAVNGKMVYVTQLFATDLGLTPEAAAPVLTGDKTKVEASTGSAAVPPACADATSVPPRCRRSR